MNKIKQTQSIYIENQEELQIIEIQEYRSYYRKYRYNLIPILQSILNECPHNSNLLDLAIRYDKFKQKQQTELNIESILHSVNFSQGKDNINPYQTNSNVESQQQKICNFWELIDSRKSSNIVLKKKVDLLKKLYDQQICEVERIKQENQSIQNEIDSYFEQPEQQNNDESMLRSINLFNYNSQDHQQYFQELYQLKVPYLEKQKQELMQQLEQEKVKMQQLNEELDQLDYQQLENNLTESQQYINQLQLVKQQLYKQIEQIKDKTNYMDIEQQNIKIQESVEQLLKLLNQQMPAQQLIEFNQMLEKTKILRGQQKNRNTSILESILVLDELEELETQFKLKNEYIINQQQQKKAKIKEQIEKIKNQNSQLEKKIFEFSQNNNLDIQLEKYLQEIQEIKDNMKQMDREEKELEYQNRLQRDQKEWISSQLQRRTVK